MSAHPMRVVFAGRARYPLPTWGLRTCRHAVAVGVSRCRQPPEWGRRRSGSGAGGGRAGAGAGPVGDHVDVQGGGGVYAVDRAQGERFGDRTQEPPVLVGDRVVAVHRVPVRGVLLVPLPRQVDRYVARDLQDGAARRVGEQRPQCLAGRRAQGVTPLPPFPAERHDGAEYVGVRLLDRVPAEQRQVQRRRQGTSEGGLAGSSNSISSAAMPCPMLPPASVPTRIGTPASYAARTTDGKRWWSLRRCSAYPGNFGSAWAAMPSNRSMLTIVGTRLVPRRAISSIRSTDRPVPCSTESTPARTSIATVCSSKVCAATRAPASWAASITAAVTASS